MAKSYWLIGEGIRTGRILHRVEAEIWVDTQNGRRTKDMNVTGRDVQAVNSLTLVLTQNLLVELIRRLKVITRQGDVQVERVFRVRAVIQTIENVSGGATVVQNRELRRVQESSRAFEVKSDEVPELRISVAERGILRDSSE